MNEPHLKSCTAFAGERLVASGPLGEVALRAKEILDRGDSEPVLIFNDLTSDLVEVDFRGSAKEVLARIQKAPAPAPVDLASPDAPRGPGRPKLGVIGREVTLLPRHWDWLDTQPGGASVTIRKLVEEAKRTNAGRDGIRAATEATYKFMRAMAGDLPGFEAATRILFASGKERRKDFETQVAAWPKAIRAHVLGLATQTFGLEAAEAKAARKGPA